VKPDGTTFADSRQGQKSLFAEATQFPAEKSVD
jgi:hypothetical protein